MVGAGIVAEVGKFYAVPCVQVDKPCRSAWVDASGWVPVMGPKHTDAEHLEFQPEHWHIDWRFVGHRAFKWAMRGAAGSPLAKVLTNDTGSNYDHKLTRAPELRRIKCKREMPVFPIVRKFTAGKYSPGSDLGERWARMERAQAITCNKLKPGNICPHRGIDLTPFVKPDGTVVCPGHGLRWDTKTGDLLPYQASAA